MDLKRLLSARPHVRPALVVLGCAVLLCAAQVLVSYSTLRLVPGASIGRDIMTCLVGLILLAAFARLPFRLLERPASYLYALAIALLLATIGSLGLAQHGAQRWINLRWATISPTAFVVPAVILFLARVCATDPSSRRNKPRSFLPALSLLLPVGIMMVQPNLVVAITLLLTGGAILFVSGAKVHRAWIVGSLVMVATVALSLRSYQIQRISSAFFGGGEGSYQVKQALFAASRGGLWGVGWSGDPANQTFLPSAQSDFVLASIAERTGFLGVLVISLVYVFLLLGMYKIGRAAKDQFTSMAILGFSYWFGVEVLLHYAVNLGMLPVGAVYLPLMSRGGSAALVHLAAIGLVVSVGLRPTWTEFEANEWRQSSNARGDRWWKAFQSGVRRKRLGRALGFAVTAATILSALDSLVRLFRLIAAVLS